MKRKVIYVSIGRLTDKMVQDCYIDHLIGNGVNVEYWDAVSLLREEHAERHAITPAYLRVLRTFRELEGLLQQPENRDALYVILITYTGRFARLFRMLSKHRCRMLTFAWGTLPHDPMLKSRKIIAWLSTPTQCAREIINRVKADALRRFRLVQPFDVAFAAGEEAKAGSKFAARVVPINYFDYDEYLKAQAFADRKPVVGRYAVFLDINLPYHSDHATASYRRVDSAGYFRSLNRFFDLLERQHALKVVIAAHPKADYNSSIFAGRPTCRLMTATLVRDAVMVLSHSSTSMSYAVLNAKPLMFIYTSEMVSAFERWIVRDIRLFAEYLDAPIYNVDLIDDARQIVVPQVNAACYERYKYNFLISREAEGVATRDIFWREIAAQLT
jgi:hypothetical protein